MTYFLLGGGANVLVGSRKFISREFTSGVGLISKFYGMSPGYWASVKGNSLYYALNTRHDFLGGPRRNPSFDKLVQPRRIVEAFSALFPFL